MLEGIQTRFYHSKLNNLNSLSIIKPLTRQGRKVHQSFLSQTLQITKVKTIFLAPVWLVETTQSELFHLSRQGSMILLQQGTEHNLPYKNLIWINCLNRSKLQQWKGRDIVQSYILSTDKTTPCSRPTTNGFLICLMGINCSRWTATWWSPSAPLRWESHSPQVT